MNMINQWFVKVLRFPQRGKLSFTEHQTNP
jgi:hypothetical protein